MSSRLLASSVLALILGFLLHACSQPAQQPSVAGSEVPGSPERSAPAGSALPALSERRTDCTRDDECGLFNGHNEGVAKAGGPTGCCLHSIIPDAQAANKHWLAELDRFCASRPPGPCPGGNSPPPKAVCQAGHCAVAFVP